MVPLDTTPVCPVAANQGERSVVERDVSYYAEIGLWFLWGTLLVILTLWGSGRLRTRLRLRKNEMLKRYEGFVASWMLLVGVGMVCMMLLVLLTVLARR